jgi:tetratricopeptide (TPR) repeat protein
MYGEPSGPELAEGLAAESSGRLIDSFRANINLATMRIAGDHPRDALPLLKRAIELDSKNARPHTLTAEAQRKLHNWVAALKSADAAVAIDPEGAEAQFHRACALTQLRRTTEAVAALKKSVESDDELYSADEIEKEPDLKPLAALPAFKKLIAEIRRLEEGQAEPQKKEPDKRN